MSASALACSTEIEPGENLETASEAVWGAQDDTNTRKANVVVSIGGCTGTLISPRIVLTAAHCVTNGFLDPRERAGLGNGGHSAAWLSAHGKTANTFWYGETDYTGACDTAEDPDCDYWYSSHDDAPTVFNPEQGGPSTTPCGGLCGNPTTISSQYYNSGQLGSAATCHQSYQPMTGFVCGNVASSRTVKINGVQVFCGQNVTIPPTRQGGYCVQTSAGPYDWAYFTTW